MTAPALYLWLPGTAREALAFYRSVFGGEVGINTFAEFGRADGPPDAVAHGMLTGPVTLFVTDAAGDEEALSVAGLAVALLGTASPETLTAWFDALSEGGRVLEPLQERAWGDSDGQVVDRFGIRWLVGFTG